jgi:hypothetical protein
MANKIKDTVDYFPFFVGDGRTLYMLKRKFGISGIGFFTEFFRFLSRTPGHYYSLQNDYDKDRFFDFIGIPETEAMPMIECLLETGKIDKGLWQAKRVLVSSDFLESLTEAYRRRSGSTPTMDYVIEQCNSIPDIDINNIDDNMPSICSDDDANMPHKEKKIKEEKTREKGGELELVSSMPSAIDKGVVVATADKKLHNEIRAYYESKQPTKQFTNYPKEGKAINELIKKAKKQAPDDYINFLTMMTNAFAELRNTTEFYKGQPFLPSALNSSGIFDRVLNEAHNRYKEHQAASNFDAKEFYK